MKTFKSFLYSKLLKCADVCDTLSNKFQGAAYRLRPQKKVNITLLEKSNWQQVRPCFVLSTGRCGTLLLTKLLSLSPEIYVVHHPRPELIRASKYAYEAIHEKPEIFRETFKSAREELVLSAIQREQIFVETNNRITFFAPIIRDVFPNAVFIHLVRHPGDFVRSGIRRGWYSKEHEHDIGRIEPVSGKHQENWSQYSSLQKIGWLWNETNQFIEQLKLSLPSDAFFFLKARDLFSDISIKNDILKFICVEPIHKMRILTQLKPANVQKKGHYPPYNEWPQREKDLLKQVAPLMQKYRFE